MACRQIHEILGLREIISTLWALGIMNKSIEEFMGGTIGDKVDRTLSSQEGSALEDL